jgi:hypothetical protein
MGLTDDYEPVVLLNDRETFSGLGGCDRSAPTHGLVAIPSAH